MMSFHFAKGRLVALLVGITFISAVLVPPLLLDSGLDTAKPVGKFLNGAFPTVPPIATGGEWMANNAFPALDFTSPIAMVQEPRSNRMILAEHGGLIWAFENSPQTSQKSLFLDLSEKVGRQGEAGFLNFAFHPNFGNSFPYFFAFYVHRDPITKRLYERVSRFEVLLDSGFVDPNSELVLIHQYDRQDSHNGGGFFFGNDGYLYIALGDEGGARNPWGNSQSIDNRLFGGILRIDVNQDSTRSHPIRRQPHILDELDSSYTANFFIPNDNPWVSPDSSVLEEFFAIGLRNPHRISQDPFTGTGHIGEVGQGLWEEIDLLQKGANYQWSYKQGNADSQAEKPDSLLFVGTDTPPIHTYDHKNGDNCIIGGFVYRGQKHQELRGKYLFADNGSKRIRTLVRENDTSHVEELFVANVGGTGYKGISSFATDAGGEIYLLVLNGAGEPGGKVFKISKEEEAGTQFPRLLSQTGAFTNMLELTPADFLVPYEPIEPFWSDGMVKKRWMAIPNDSTYDSEGEKIANSGENWNFPTGSVFIKHFELPAIDSNQAYPRRIETRFLVHGEEGKYYGLTYRWLPEGQDAILLDTGLDEVITFEGADGTTQSQTWHYPSRAECFSCHQEAVGTILGAREIQLNWEIAYPTTGRTANQLHTLNSLGMFADSLDEAHIIAINSMVNSQDSSASLEMRAKSYLQANCANCHSPGTGLRSAFDTRFNTPLDSSGLVYGIPLELIDNTTHLIVPGDTSASVLYQRLKSLEIGIAMPPISKNAVDIQGVELIGEWILSMGDTTSVITEEPNEGEPEQEEGPAKVLQVISYDSIPNKTLQDPPFEVQVGSSSGLAVQVTVVGGPARYENDSLYLTGEIGRVLLELSQAGDSVYLPSETVRLGFWVQRVQALTFPDISDKLALDPSFELGASTTSELAVTYEILQGPASISGNQVALGGVSGFVLIEARQAGNEEYAPASPIQKGFMVNKVPQQLVFPEIGELFANIPPFRLQAFSDSQLPVQFAILEGPARVSGDTLNIYRGASTITISAWIEGDTTYLASDTIYQIIPVKKAPQELIFPEIPTLEVFSSYPLTASVESGREITFEVISGMAEILDQNVLRPLGLGTVEIEAIQPGDSIYEAASGRKSVEIVMASQSISFPEIPDKLISDDPFLLDATSTSGLPIDLYIESGPAILSGAALFLTGEPGRVKLIATQEGNQLYHAATPIVRSFEVRDTAQTDSDPLITSELSNLAEEIHLRVFPNPTQSLIQVQMEYRQVLELSLSVYSSTGQQLLHEVFPTFQGLHQKTISLEGLSSGVYWLHVQAAQYPGNAARIPVVKE